jgi:multiple sugar transport system substrate-binding protein
MLRLIRLTGAAMAVLVAAGCASGTSGTSSSGAAASSQPAAGFSAVPASQHVSITFASYLPTLGPAGTDELSSLISGFEAAHPNIHVSIEAETSSATIAAQVQQDEVSGHPPDVVQDSFNDLKFLTSNLGALDLDKVAGPANVAAIFGGATPYATAVTKLGEVDGDVYGIPWTLSTPVLFYNASLFTKAGLAATPPASWAQVQADAAKIKSATGAAGLVTGCIGAAASGSDWCLQALLDSDGGSVMNGAQTALTFDAPGNAAALTAMQGLTKAGVMVNLSSAQMIEAFAAGKLAMVLDTSALASTLVKATGGQFTMEAAPLPGFGSAPSVPTNSGSALFVLSKERPQQEADFELMQYLTSASAETSITTNVGYPPLRTVIATMPQYLAAYSAKNQFLAPNVAQLPRLSPWLSYPGPNYAAITTLLTNAAANIVFQGADAATTLAGAQQQAEGLLS